jgi:hypothetical protein
VARLDNIQVRLSIVQLISTNIVDEEYKLYARHDKPADILETDARAEGFLSFPAMGTPQMGSTDWWSAISNWWSGTA